MYLYVVIHPYISCMTTILKPFFLSVNTFFEILLKSFLPWKFFVPECMMQMNRNRTFQCLCIPFFQKIHDHNMILICILCYHIQIKIHCKRLLDRLCQHWHELTKENIMRSLYDRTMKGNLRLNTILTGWLRSKKSWQRSPNCNILCTSSLLALLQAKAAASGSKIIRVS